MVAAFATPDLRPVIERHAPEAVVHEDWSPFRVAASRADCVIVAFHEPGGEVTEERLRKLGAPGQPPLIIVTQPDGASLDLIGRITCFRCVATRNVETRLAGAVAEALALSPRVQLAQRLLGSLDPDGLSAEIVREVLLEEEPVANGAQLEDRLKRKQRALRWEWDREGRLLTDCTLHAFIRWGRHLRAVEALGRGLTPLEVAVMLDINELQPALTRKVGGSACRRVVNHPSGLRGNCSASPSDCRGARQESIIVMICLRFFRLASQITKRRATNTETECFNDGLLTELDAQPTLVLLSDDRYRGRLGVQCVAATKTAESDAYLQSCGCLHCCFAGG